MGDACVDLYCGLGGWAEGFIAEDFEVIGFDVERHDYGTGAYPGQLVLQDVRTIHGSQLVRGAMRDRLKVIVASPPCQKYSYMAMPWKRAKALAAWYRESPERIVELNALFNACFRIQKEASEAAGRYIPLVVENVRGARPWVGQAKWNFGSYYLWGDVPALMPITLRAAKMSGFSLNPGPNKWRPHTTGGDENSVKVPGFRFDGSGKSFQTAAVNGQKGIPHRTSGHWTNPAEGEGIKQHGSGREWFAGEGKISRMTSSHSDSRKAASAQIAKIPFPLARHIARVFKAGMEKVEAQAEVRNGTLPEMRR